MQIVNNKTFTFVLSLFIATTIGCGGSDKQDIVEDNKVIEDDNKEEPSDADNGGDGNDGDGNEGNGSDDQIVIPDPNVNHLSLTSDAFKDTGSQYYNLPLNYTCDGAQGGVSPTLTWQGLPSGTSHVALTMRSNSDNEPNKVHFTLFNIPASQQSLAEGDFSIADVVLGVVSQNSSNNTGYIPPCPSGAGETTLYTFTLYALYAPVELDDQVTEQQALEAFSPLVLESASITTQYIRYDQQALSEDRHVPSKAVTNCQEKIDHFNQYAAVHQSISCDESSDQLSVISHISDGLKTTMPEQQVQVGIERWIGRLPLVSQTGSEIKVTPNFYQQANNNVSCDGTGFLGVTVDGQLIFPFFKQNNDSGSGDSCGPTDGVNYADRDTVVLGEVDQCYGHSPNGEGYHLHGPPICLMDVHDPSKPIAYMADGIPLYFGQGGGTITDTLHAQSAKSVTQLNYGAGLYEHLDYRPSDVKDGTNPLNECNAYDINGDGAVSGYVYYTTKDAPYTIGCFMGETLTNPKKTQVIRTQLERNRSGWLGQEMGEAINVSILSSSYDTFADKTYNVTEMLVKQSTSYLTAGDHAQVLWRVLDQSDSGYQPNTSCFEFRYRANKEITNSDETEVVCTRNQIPTATLDYTPFGDLSTQTNKHAFKLEAWADNWFAAYLDQCVIVEDSVAISTEKSFNAETAIFAANYPLHLNFIIKDFKQDDTGLEYIGTDRQQMGDGGFIAQLTDLTTNEVVAISNASWACTVSHRAPLDKNCASEQNPVAGIGSCQFQQQDIDANWKLVQFDDSSWTSTTEHSEADVRPKDGYEQITWHDNAKFIWGPDLQIDNTLFCRVTVEQP